MKFNKSFTPSSKVGEDNAPVKEKVFVRDDSDNKLFPEIQVKDIGGIITEDCVGAWDFDGVVYRACSNMENRLIRVKHKTEDVEEVLQNITTFKGRGKKISENSWLGLKNIEREVEGLEPYLVDDFEVEQFQELKMDHDKAIEQVKIQIFLKIKQVKQQYRIPNVKILLGGGSTFRTDLNQCRLYKGSRKNTLRPLLLKEIRQWVMDELDSEFAEPLPDGRKIECDDLSNMYGVTGYLTYRKTGKFNFLEISSDKDSLQTGKLLINPDTHVGEHNPLQGRFKFPQAMLIEATDRCAGNVELIVKGGEKSTTKELKGYGFKFLMFQSILGNDSADYYNAIGDLEQGFNCGHTEAFKVLKPCKTAKDSLQACIDYIAELLPYGVQYTSHKDNEFDVDTLTYFNEYFKTAYMLRNEKDEMDLYKLCELMKADTSKIVDNNKLTPPKRTFVGSEQHIVELQDLFNTILKEDMKGCKQLKSKEKDAVFDTIKAKLEGVDFEVHYEMQQEEK